MHLINSSLTVYFSIIVLIYWKLQGFRVVQLATLMHINRLVVEVRDNSSLFNISNLCPCQAWGQLYAWSNNFPKYLEKNIRVFAGGLVGKESTWNAGDPGSIPGRGRSPGEESTTHSSILAWRIPWTQGPSGLQSMGLQRVWHNLVTNPPPHLIEYQNT